MPRKFPVHPEAARLDRALEVPRQFRANELRNRRKARSASSYMASFSKRNYSSRRLVCSAEPSLNATFDKEDSAHARLRQLSEQGQSGLKVRKFSRNRVNSRR